VVLASCSGYSLNDSPTMPPIDHQYQMEAFISYLQIEQYGYPDARAGHELDSLQGMECITNLVVAKLPGVIAADVFWNTSTFWHSFGIWNSEETYYMQFELDYVPESIGFQTPNAHLRIS